MTHFLAAVAIVSFGAAVLIAVIVWRSPPSEHKPDPRYGMCDWCRALTVYNHHLRAWVHCDERGTATTCRTPRAIPPPILKARKTGWPR